MGGERDDKAALLAFLEQHPEPDELDGLFWCEAVGDYRCVVLARHGKRRLAAEFKGATPALLVDKASEYGVNLGDPADVKGLCESAGRSRHLWRKRRGASHAR